MYIGSVKFWKIKTNFGENLFYKIEFYHLDPLWLYIVHVCKYQIKKTYQFYASLVFLLQFHEFM